MKYLGHFIYNTLRDDKEILRRRRQLYASGNTLLRTFYMTLFRTFCSHMYTAQVGWNYSVASLHKLHVAYNNVIMLIAKSA